MTVAIVLLRGINVGGKSSLPMAELRGILAGLGLEDVRTYIQSGNVVLRCAQDRLANLGKEIAAAVEEQVKFRPAILVLSASDWRRALASNPYPEATVVPQSLHLFFLADQARRPDLAKAAELRAVSESFELRDRVFYLHAPDGIGRSKLAGRVEQLLGVPTTARNWRTVQKLAEMAAASETGTD